VTLLDTYPFNIFIGTVTTDSCGHVFAGLSNGEVNRYRGANPGSKTYITTHIPVAGIQLRSIALSLDHRLLYMSGPSPVVYSLDLEDGTIALVAEVKSAWRVDAGMAIAPYRTAREDFDHDGIVGTRDFAYQLREWTGPGVPAPSPCFLSDVTGEGAVEMRDFAQRQDSFRSE